MKRGETIKKDEERLISVSHEKNKKIKIKEYKRNFEHKMKKY